MQIYLVGGAVRDQLLGLEVVERDWVVVGASVEQMLALGYQQVGKDFPVFLHPETKEEYALARTERKTGSGYTGFSVHAAADVTLEEDLQRRDLTINAMAQTDSGQIIDPFDGQADLAQGVLRHVSPAFSEDPVRILRAARFAARFGRWGFHVAHSTNRLMRAMVAAGEIDALVPERVWKETQRALATEQPLRFFQALLGCNAFTRLFPELAPLFHTATSPAAHSTALEQSMAARIIQLASVQLTDAGERFACVALALHAVDNTTSSDSAAQAINQLCKRLKVPTDDRTLALLCIRNYAQYCQLAHLTHAQVVTLLETLDAFRRPQRIAAFLRICNVRIQLELNTDLATTLAQSETFQAYLNAAQSVRAKDFHKAKLQGPALGEAIRAARIDAVAQQRIA